MMPPPARQLSFGDEYMPKFNWRSPDDTYYHQIEKAEMTGMAWECLRRSATFEQDCQTISSQGRPTDDGFRQHWGLVFRSRPGAILSRADDLLGSRGRADDCAGSPGIARQLGYTRQAGSQQCERKPIPASSGWLARRAASARRQRRPHCPRPRRSPDLALQRQDALRSPFHRRPGPVQGTRPVGASDAATLERRQIHGRTHSPRCADGRGDLLNPPAFDHHRLPSTDAARCGRAAG